MSIGLFFIYLSLFGYDTGDIRLVLGSNLPVACQWTSTGCSTRMLFRTQQHRHLLIFQHSSMGATAHKNRMQLVLIL